MLRRIDGLCGSLWRRAQERPQGAAAGIALLVTMTTMAGLAWLTTRQAPHRLAGGWQASAVEPAAAMVPIAAIPEAPPVAAASDPLAGSAENIAQDLQSAEADSTGSTTVAAAAPAVQLLWEQLPPKQRLVAMLEEGRALLERARDFKAVLIKQERRRNELGDVEELQVKMRREPFSVYLKWCDPSPPHEILWQIGRDDDKLLYHDGGWKGRMAPLLKVDPAHKLVKAMSRRPLAKIGPWELARELAGRRESLDLHDTVVTVQPAEGPDGRACLEFSVVHPQPRPEVERHRTVLFVDLEWKIPVGCDIYDWPSEHAPEEPVLLESYYYSEIEFDTGLKDNDFDPTNPSYGFRKLAAKQ